MGTKKKIEAALIESKKSAKEEAKWFIERMFQSAEDIRAMSLMSKDINEFSEALDTMVNKLMDMKNQDIRILSRYM